mgnify:CR=1 FL=1
MLHYPGREVLYDDITFRDELFYRGQTAAVVEIEGDAKLAGIHAVRYRRALPKWFVFGEKTSGETHAIGMLCRFDLDDLRTEQGEAGPGHWPRPERGKIEHTQALHGQVCISLRGFIPRCPVS